MDLRGRWCFQVVWPSRASAERQEVEDYAFVKKFSKVEKPKAPQVPKAAEGILRSFAGGGATEAPAGMEPQT